jgi:hypothetical protein
MTYTTISGVAKVPAANWRTPARREPAPAGAWFEAATGHGALRLYATGTPRHAVEAAVALARHEALLDALDAWLGAALDWRWIAAPEAPTAGATHARALWRPEPDGERGEAAAAERACGVEMPWPLLRMLPAPDQTFARQLRWQEVRAVLVVSRLLLGADELALLEPGGAVVLPDSMTGDWHATLHALDQHEQAGAGVPVSLKSPDAPQRLAVGAQPAVKAASPGDRVACEVRLSLAQALPGDRLAGWYEGDLGETGARASLWSCATEREPATCLAAGELMPWGDGRALAVQEIHALSASA